jgi:hypothetical protein
MRNSADSGSRRMQAAKGFWLVFSPELIDPGNQCFGPKNTPNVIFIATTPVTGTGQRSAELAMSLARPTGLER